MKKKILSLFLACIMVLSIIPVMSVSAAETGTCGENVNYTLDDNGNLIISGTGPMTDYKYYNSSTFYGKTEIKTVTIGNGVTTIGRNAFYDCTKLETLTIPADTELTSIGDYAFADCSALTSVSIPASVTTIGNKAFKDCSKLATVNIPADSELTSIGGSAFWRCSALTSISIPASVTTIGNDAFNSCSKLATVTIPENSELTSIGNSAFCACEALTSVSIPASVTTIGSDVFNGCIALETLNIHADSQLTSIGRSMFSGLSALKSISIPASVTTIGDKAFKDCSKLATVTIPENSELTSIGNFAFKNCGALTSIFIPASVTTIGNFVFDGCSALETVNIHEDSQLTSIGDSMFSGLSALKSISIPASVTSISNSAFSGCSALKSISIPASVTTIGEAAFAYCSKLATVTIPENSELTSIGDFAFEYCGALTSIFIPASVTTIGKYAFYDCIELETVTIPENSELASIGHHAFYACSALETVTIPADSQLTSIDRSVFNSCIALTSISIPASVTSISDYAFDGCAALTSISIPASVTTIGKYAFADCSKLEKVSFLNPQCEIANDDSVLPSNTVIYGYKGSTAEAYAENFYRKFSPIYNVEFVEGYPATCTEDGMRDHYHCTVTGSLFLDEECTKPITEADIVIKATGHNLSEWEPQYNGTHTRDCTNEGCTYKETKNCTFGEWTVTKEATCTENGKKQRVCSVCGYVEEADIQASEHNIEKIKAVEPTCTEEGNNEYYYCPICDKYFKDAEGNTETTVEAETLDALGHKMEKINAAEPTCTETGNKEYYHCPVCNKYFKDAEGKTETTVEAETLDVLGHKMEKIDAVTPTCTTAGSNEYYHCTVCDKYFKDAEGKTETTVNEEILAAPGHKWDEGKITKTPTCTEDGIKTYTCPVCGETRTEVIKATGHVDADGDGKCDNCGESLSGGNTWFDKLESFFNLIIAILYAVADFLDAIGV